MYKGAGSTVQVTLRVEFLIENQQWLSQGCGGRLKGVGWHPKDSADAVGWGWATLFKW